MKSPPVHANERAEESVSVRTSRAWACPKDSKQGELTSVKNWEALYLRSRRSASINL